VRPTRIEGRLSPEPGGMDFTTGEVCSTGSGDMSHSILSPLARRKGSMPAAVRDTTFDYPCFIKWQNPGLRKLGLKLEVKQGYKQEQHRSKVCG
jgi:hypothetical protein